MEAMIVQAAQHCNGIMSRNSNHSEELYTDLNDWLGTVYPTSAAEKPEELSDKLQHWYKATCDVLGVPQETRCTVYPCYISSSAATLNLHLWQLGFASESFIRGNTPAYNLFKVMEKDMLDGGNTAKHPIEVVPFLGGKSFLVKVPRRF